MCRVYLHQGIILPLRCSWLIVEFTRPVRPWGKPSAYRWLALTFYFSTACSLVSAQVTDLSQQHNQTENHGAAKIVSALLRHQWDLLDTAQRAILGEIDQQFYKLESRSKKPKSNEAHSTFAKTQATVEKKLVQLLGSITNVVRVTIVNGLTKTAETEPVTLPGDTGALFIRIQSGDKETRYETLSYDLSSDQDSIHYVVAPAGVTWALIELSHLPAGRTSLLLKLDGIKDRWIPLLVDVSTPLPGRLKIAVLSDRDGKPVPAMVRMVWTTDGTVRKPSNALELAPQFDNQGSPADPRNAMLPGKLAGEYWCVPGPFDMMVSPGDWEITIRRGIEYTPITDSFTVDSGQSINKTYPMRRWVDMPKRGWYSGDAHVHFRMLSDTDAKHMMTWAKSEDIHVTNILKMGDINRTWFQQRGFGPDSHYIDGDFVLVPGQECPRTHEQLGHILALNTRGMVRNPQHYYLYDEVFDAVHAQGGLTGYAHVGSNNFHVHRDMSINVPAGRADFVEIMQFGKLATPLYYEFLNLGFKLTAAAGSDVPWGGTVGEVRMYAYVGSQPFSADAWFDAVKRGRTFVTNGPMIEFKVDEAMPGEEVIVTAGQVVRVKAKAWCDPQHMTQASIQIVQNGDVIQRTNAQVGATEMTVDFSLPSGNGFWIAARATCGNGSQAHTTPVYVIRKSLRFWKYASVDKLVRKRLESLNEVEAVVATARNLHHQGRIDYHRPWMQFSLQSTDLLTRVAKAREFYGHLQAVVHRERAIRTNNE